MKHYKLNVKTDGEESYITREALQFLKYHLANVKANHIPDKQTEIYHCEKLIAKMDKEPSHA